MNYLLCDQEYELNYAKQIKEGWGEYSNMFCKVNSVNSFGYLYNAKKGEISIGGTTTMESVFRRIIWKMIGKNQ